MKMPRTFRCDVPAGAVADLHERIDRARWPDQINDAGWSYGTELNYLRELVDYWRHGFDWPSAQAEINRFSHFLLDIDGLDIHFLHQRSPHANATPLLITHGSQSLGYGLHDSPMGLCAWIAEKFHDWSDCRGDIRNAISWDRLLTNISLYWFTNSVVSSLRLYKETQAARGLDAPQQRVEVSFGMAVYPYDIYHTPRAWVERRFNVRHGFVAEKGGHFAAMEQPQTFAEDLRRFKQACGATL
jgi:pimeloyl-ACP methyl ester carboxylesterase